ncbi:MAG TPA: hypothetical protein VJN95_02885 [Gemmatimonadales bacterium]|nr:hypothetical protein [Gemmatimonadales bacterium]
MNSACKATLFAVTLPALLAAQAAPPPSADVQIAGAVSPAPDSLKAGATVLGYDAGGQLVPLRHGTNNLICLADNPASKDFHPACYQKELEPFMARGRALRAQGLKRAAIDSVRFAEIMSGALRMPQRPTTLYEFYGKKENFDSTTGKVAGASAVYVVYTPYATEESSGLSTIPLAGGPWLMYPGKPWAHIMIVPEKPKAAGAQ